MKRSLLIGCLILPAACAGTPPELVQSKAEGPRLGPSEIVAARQAAFGLSGATFGALSPPAAQSRDAQSIGFSAQMLARWGRTLPSMFPEGTGLPESRALPAVWTDRQDFKARADALAAAADRLGELAAAGDRSAYARQWNAVKDACTACHQKFRAEKAPSRS